MYIFTGLAEIVEDSKSFRNTFCLFLSVHAINSNKKSQSWSDAHIRVDREIYHQDERYATSIAGDDRNKSRGT